MDGFYDQLGRTVWSGHLLRQDGLCSCGMDRDACSIARLVRTVLLAQRRRDAAIPPAPIIRYCRGVAGPTGPGWVRQRRWNCSGRSTSGSP